MRLISFRGLARNLRYGIDRLRAKFSYLALADGNVKNFTFKQLSSDTPNVLFVTSNGAGMGHITRCLAIATAGRDQFHSSFITLSSSAAVVGDQGFEYLYFQSAAKTGQPARLWNNHFYQLMMSVLKRNHFDAVVFDGTWVYRGLEGALDRFQGTRLIWLRRGLWKKEARADQLIRMEARSDGIISPWDVGCGYEDGPLKGNGNSTGVNGIVYLPTGAPYSREESLSALGLDAGSRYALIQLGAGNINDIADVRSQVLADISALGQNRIVPVLAISPLSTEKFDVDGVRILRRYPLSPYLAAFDFVVSAAGYNSVHEIVRWNIPSLIIPNELASTDDQIARARGASDLPFCIMASTSADIRNGITQLVNGSYDGSPIAMSRNRQHHKAIQDIDGGEQAAEVIFDMIQTD
ncbi:glycosyltransferase [Paeniglutamicibacter sp. MACA_103]|uniref:glycosyltransferase n=1 Tax=Paeniglutamicibacter sp. MACA_103 TaxID=3377337 RepID=UPI0038941BCC